MLSTRRWSFDDVMCKQVAWRNEKFSPVLRFTYIFVHQTRYTSELEYVINRL